MFSTLSKGSVLYGLDRRDKVKWFTASIDSINPTYAKASPNMFGQMPELRLDIVAVINGEKRTFQQVPSNNAIADFGENSFVIADNKDSLFNYTKKLLSDSEAIVKSCPFHEEKIPQYKEVLNELMPGSADTGEVKALKEEVTSLKSQLAEVITLLKAENNKSKE
ncbi:MAG: hypothetical protein IJG68_01930 [Bacilli bacterium]|nr:hypothetical protein [Bacilli bacterium]